MASDSHQVRPWLGAHVLKRSLGRKMASRRPNQHLLTRCEDVAGTSKAPTVCQALRQLMASLQTRSRARLPRQTPHRVTLGKWLAFSEPLLLRL